MKVFKLIVLFLGSLPFSVCAQQVTCFNENWKTCSKDLASYYRIAEKKDTVWIVNDYHITNEQQMSGSYKDDSLKIKDGIFTYYTKTGQISSTGMYRNNKRVGVWKGWHETGEIAYEGSADSGIWNYWYRSGKLEGIGLVINDKKEGKWKWYFKSGVLRGVETYKADDPKKVKYYNEKGKRQKHITSVEQHPSYNGGVEGLMNFLSSNIKYPEQEKTDGIEGRVFIQFDINSDGLLTNPVILKSTTTAMGEEVLRIIKLMPKWQPAYKHGKAISFRFTLPVTFRLR